MTKDHQTAQPHISEQIVRLCTSSESVSSLLARDSTLSPGNAWEKLYGHHVTKAAEKNTHEVDKANNESNSEPTEHLKLKKAAECGKWGPTKPSDLFLAIYHDALSTLNEDPRRAMVSPSLMGSYGTVPLTIISVLPDIARHMSNVIVRAQKEVYLATNYWQNSVASRYITNAIRELDRRAGARGARIVFKILYDRGSPRQLYKPHYVVSEKAATSHKVNLPHPDEIPNIDMEIMNFHTPLLGTFHAKYLLVDRRIALLQSNNIQDNDNLEMMVHLEGPIVDSFYDMALVSWSKRLNPPLSCQANSTQTTRLSEVEEEPVTGEVVEKSTVHFPECAVSLNGAGKHQSKPLPQSSMTARDGNGETDRTATTLPDRSVRQEPFALLAHTADDPHYDDDITGEIARIQSFLAPRPGRTHLQAVTELLNHTVNEGMPGDPNVPDCPPENFMTPYIPHQSHTPYPMALVNRAPYGPPTHKSISTPQNAAWISALRHAKDYVYIISPTLNASPLIPAIIETCERGVDVYCYVCLGYNDAGELLPRQGGHNEKVAAALHSSPSLSPAGRRRLHYHWYVARDRTAPVSQARRQRSSHVKLLIADGRVAIQGSGNQDTQSWFHSEEANVLIDSPALCAAWLDALRRNQNTALFGAVDPEDGVWRDSEGRQAEGAIGPDAGGVFGWVKGAKGAVERLRGTGGF